MSAKVGIKNDEPQIIYIDLSEQVSFEDIQTALSKARRMFVDEFTDQYGIVLLNDDRARYSMSMPIIKAFQTFMDALPQERGGLLIASQNPSMGYLCQHLTKGLARPFSRYEEAKEFANELIRTHSNGK